MSCCCGHGAWHRRDDCGPPRCWRTTYYPHEDFYDRPMRRRRRGGDPEELEEHLKNLQDEIDDVREELASLRKAGETQS